MHLIDKADGEIDGIPELLVDKQYVIPWMEMVRKEMENIHQNESDIDPYGGLNESEFFSVVSEYFFERPKLLEKKHPNIYKLLNRIFTHDLSLKFKPEIKKEIIGPRPGEKIYEELMTESEARKAFETNDMLIIPPQVNIGINLKVSDYKNARVSKLKRYISKDVKPLSKDGINKLLVS